jgi:aminotransferase
MTLRFAQRVEELKQSDIRAVTKRINEIGGINLGQGLCPLPTDERVRNALIKAVADGYNIYSPMEGLPECRQAVAEKMARHNQVECNWESEVLITSGASAAFACAVDTLFNPGDEIILFEPCYGYHVNIAKLRGVVPVMVRTVAPNWELDLDAVRAAITPKTRAVLICTPANPSGKVFTRAELEELASICQEHDLVAITDEVYEYIVYEDAEHISMASIPGMFSRTLTISAATKTFFVTGWRVGWAVGPSELIQKMANVADLNYICAPSPNQKGIADALRLPQSFFDNLGSLFYSKRAKLVTALRNAGLNPSVPPGAYYIMANYSENHPWKTDEEARDALIDGIGVGSVTGSSFFGGLNPSGLLRFCFAVSEENLDAGCAALEKL